MNTSSAYQMFDKSNESTKNVLMMNHTATTGAIPAKYAPTSFLIASIIPPLIPPLMIPPLMFLLRLGVTWRYTVA